MKQNSDAEKVANSCPLAEQKKSFGNPLRTFLFFMAYFIN